MLDFALRRAGFEVLVADTGGLALNILEASPVDAVVQDLILPDGRGSALLSG